MTEQAKEPPTKIFQLCFKKETKGKQQQNDMSLQRKTTTRQMPLSLQDLSQEKS